VTTGRVLVGWENTTASPFRGGAVPYLNGKKNIEREEESGNRGTLESADSLSARETWYRKDWR
jgi:hypothetical protein